MHLASNSDNSARGSASSIFDTTSWSWNELEGDRAPKKRISTQLWIMSTSEVAEVVLHNVAGHARGEISNTPSKTSAIPMCSKSKADHR